MYLRIGQFATVTERDMRAALAEFQKQGGKALVLDLRFCRGGYVDAAVKIAEMFLTEGDLIIRIQPRERNAIEYRARKKTIDAKSPMVCLVNPGALSAAEFLTACLQDHHRAVVIGERTAGWVSIPNAVEFKSEREDARPMIRLATAVFQRPSGTNLSRMMTSGREDEVWGVYPDPGYEIKLTPKESTELEEHLRRPEVIPRPDRPLPPIPEFRDRQLEKAVEYLRTTMK
jgi:carboxyl-terminal processing protease